MSPKRIVTFAIIAIVALSIAARWAPRLFLGHRAATTAPTAEWTERRYEDGDIVKVDLDKHEIVLRVGTRLDGSEVPIAIDPKTRIHLGDEVLTLSELRPGDHATVRLETPPPSATEPHAAEVRLARAAVP